MASHWPSLLPPPPPLPDNAFTTHPAAPLLAAYPPILNACSVFTPPSLPPAHAASTPPSPPPPPLISHSLRTKTPLASSSKAAKILGLADIQEATLNQKVSKEKKYKAKSSSLTKNNKENENSGSGAPKRCRRRSNSTSSFEHAKKLMHEEQNNSELLLEKSGSVGKDERKQKEKNGDVTKKKKEKRRHSADKSVNEGVVLVQKAIRLAANEQRWWHQAFPPCSPNEALISGYICKYINVKGTLFVSTHRLTFAEDHHRNKGGFTKKIIAFTEIMAIKKTIIGTITLTSTDLISETFSDFENSKTLQVLYNILLDVWQPFQKESQSLHTAIETRNLKRLHALLRMPSARERMTTEINGYRELPLQAAITANDPALARAILQFYRANLLNINTQDAFGYTALHTACLRNCKDEILLELLRYPDINVCVVNDDGNSPFHYFCRSVTSPSCQDTAQMFLDLGFDDLNKQNKEGETALHKAIVNDYVRVLLIDFLITKGADVNILNKRGESGLHYAVRMGRLDVVARLVAAGADTERKGDAFGKTPRQLAHDYGHNRVLEYLNKTHELLKWLKSIEQSTLFLPFVRQKLFLDKLTSPAMGESKLLSLASKINQDLHPSGNDTCSLEECKQRLKDVWLALKEGNKDLNLQKEIMRSAEMMGSEDKQFIVTSLNEFMKGSSNFIRGSEQEKQEDNWLISQSELEFTKKIGAGASGKVYKGLYRGMEVAIKVLHSMPSGEDRTESLSELLEEIKVMSILSSSEGVVKLFGVCVEPLSIVMEYCSRGSLYQYLNQVDCKIDWSQLLDITRQIVQGIHQLHSAQPQILHRDLKTHNLLITKDGKVKCCDFGLSRPNTGTYAQALGSFCGTPAYMAPELLFGQPFGAASDIYALGIVIWELVFKCAEGVYMRPYDEYKLASDAQIIYRAAETNLRPSIPQPCPLPIKDLLEQCWQASTDHRPTAVQTLQLLDNIEKELFSNC